MKIILPMRPQPRNAEHGNSLYKCDSCGDIKSDRYTISDGMFCCCGRKPGFPIPRYRPVDERDAPYSPGDEIEQDGKRYPVLSIEPRDLRKFKSRRQLRKLRLPMSCGSMYDSLKDWFRKSYPDDPFAWAWVLDVEEMKGE